MTDPVGEAWHAEQRRKSQDMIRVFNPTDQDYVLQWDEGGASAKFLVPNREKDIGWGKGMRVMQRYLARKFVKELVDKIIFIGGDQILQAQKERLQKQGAVDITYNANQNIMTMKGVRSDNEEIRKPLEDQIWLGIEEEFGVDQNIEPIKEAKPTMLIDPLERLADKRYHKEEAVAPVTLQEKVPEPVMPPEPPKKVGRPPKGAV